MKNKIKRIFKFGLLFVLIDTSGSCERCFSFCDEASFRVIEHIKCLVEFYFLRG